MDTTKDYYAILGVLPSAEVETIQAVYRALSKKYHPDVSREDPASAEAKMREINEAYEILSDAKKRKQYDDARPDTQSAGSTFYEEEDDSENTSSYADPDLDENWKRIIDYYPDLEKHRKNLELLSQDLAFTYKAYMVTERKFESEENIHLTLEANFLRKYFGSHREIQEFGKSLLLNKKKSVAQALNKDVAFFGNDIKPKKFLAKFKAKTEKQNASERANSRTSTSDASNQTPFQTPKHTSNSFFILIMVLALVGVAIVATSFRSSGSKVWDGGFCENRQYSSICR